MFRSGYSWKIEYPYNGDNLYRLYFWNESSRHWYFYKHLTKQEAERY